MRSHQPHIQAILRPFVASIIWASVFWGTTILSTVTTAFAQPEPPSPATEDDGIAKDSSTEINVKNADIAAIVRIFSKKTKRNYILDERVKGKVSIYLPGRVSAEESLRILDSVLALKGFTSVPVGENLWKIVPSREARQTTIPTQLGNGVDEASAAVVTRMLNLKYVAAEEVQQILAQLISADGLINAYTPTNSLIIIDSEDNIERLVNLVGELDVPSTDRDMSIIPVKYADATELAQKLNDILLDGGQGSKDGQGVASDLLRARGAEGNLGQPVGLNLPPGIVPPGIPQIQRGASSGVVGKTASRGREPKIIPEERTNSIIVVADEETTARVKALISQLDSKVDLSGSKFYVYRCQYSNAEDLAQVLSGLAGNGNGGSGNQTSSGGFGSGGLNSTNAGFGGFGTQGGNGNSSGGSSFGSRSRNSSTSGGSSFGGGTGGGTGAGGGGFGSDTRNGSSQNRGGTGNRSGGQGASTVQLGQNISISADPATNSLIVSASKTDYQKIRLLLEKLDVKRRQVLVEAMLLEVGIDDSLSLGTDFISSTGGADGGILARSDFGRSENSLTSLLSNPTSIQGFSLAAASAGSLTLPGGTVIPTQSILLTAAQSNSNVNVLSAPTILATDNEQAEIVVGQNVPFLASTSTNQVNLNNTFNTINRQDVGITLRLTPQISSRDFVNLKIFTEVSAVVASTLTSALGPTTTVRTSETTAISKDSQMIVIGGLMSDDVSETTSGIPFFKDIPLFGHLFNDRSEARSRKNLLIFITPRIVKDQFDHRDFTYEKTDLLSEELEASGVFPDRADVLKSERRDKIAESQLWTGQKPGTIRAPDNYGQQDDIEAESFEQGEILDLTVSPELPKGSLARPKAAASRVKQDTIAKVVPSGDRYLVLEVLNPEVAVGQAPPFDLSDGRLVGVQAPADSVPALLKFFTIGKEVGFDMGTGTLRLRVSGAFEEASDAQSLYPQLASHWYTLSPYEIMSVGQGPWISLKRQSYLERQ